MERFAVDSVLVGRIAIEVLAVSSKGKALLERLGVKSCLCVCVYVKSGKSLSLCDYKIRSARFFNTENRLHVCTKKLLCSKENSNKYDIESLYYVIDIQIILLFTILFLCPYQQFEKVDEVILFRYV